MIKDDEIIVWIADYSKFGGVICYYGSIKHLLSVDCYVRRAFGYEVERYLNLNF